MSSRSVLGLRVDSLNLEDAVRRVVDLAREGRSARVCAANVHMTMEAVDSPKFQGVVNAADLVVPDGRPLVWALGLLGVRGAEQVRGADLMQSVVALAAKEGVPIGLYGGAPETLDELSRSLQEGYPGLRIACEISPPFRPLTTEEDERYVREISASGARIMFVGLGCPKQELWAAEHAESVSAVILGVGAAFDFHAGRVRQAPRWMRSAGLEWVHRFFGEPRRLWRRYVMHNPRFLVMLASQAIGWRGFDKGVDYYG